MRLYAFQCGGDFSDKAIQDPLDDDVGTKIYQPWTAYLVDHPQGPVLFDSGVPPEILTDPAGALGPGGLMVDLRMTERDTIPSLLAGVGLTPEQVPILVLSHLHYDHAASLSLFRQADIYVQQAELDVAQAPPVYQVPFYTPHQYAGEHNWKPLDGSVDLFGDGTVEIFPTPGHTRGHQSVKITLEHETVLILFDAAYSLEKMEQRLLPGIVWSPDEMVKSWDHIDALAAEHSAVLLASHDPDVDRVRWSPDRWYE